MKYTTEIQVLVAAFIVAVLVLLVVFIACGSSESRSIDNMILKDSKGNYYKIERHMGDTFTIDTIGKLDTF